MVRDVQLSGHTRLTTISCAMPAFFFVHAIHRIRTELRNGTDAAANRRDDSLHNDRVSAQVFLLRLFVELYLHVDDEDFHRLLSLDYLEDALPATYQTCNEFRQYVAGLSVLSLARQAAAWQLRFHDDPRHEQLTLMERNFNALTFATLLASGSSDSRNRSVEH